MIKKIPVDALIPGMYVSDLNCGWMDHPFLTNAFLVDDEARVAKIRDMGIHEVYIDTGRGLDLPDAPTREEVESSLQARMEAIATAAPKPLARVNLAEEAPRARRLHTEANRIVKTCSRISASGPRSSWTRWSRWWRPWSIPCSATRTPSCPWRV